MALLAMGLSLFEVPVSGSTDTQLLAARFATTAAIGVLLLTGLFHLLIARGAIQEPARRTPFPWGIIANHTAAACGVRLVSGENPASVVYMVGAEAAFGPLLSTALVSSLVLLASWFLLPRNDATPDSPTYRQSTATRSAWIAHLVAVSVFLTLLLWLDSTGWPSGS